MVSYLLELSNFVLVLEALIIPEGAPPCAIAKTSNG